MQLIIVAKPFPSYTFMNKTYTHIQNRYLDKNLHAFTQTNTYKRTNMHIHRRNQIKTYTLSHTRLYKINVYIQVRQYCKICMATIIA